MQDFLLDIFNNTHDMCNRVFLFEFVSTEIHFHFFKLPAQGDRED